MIRSQAGDEGADSVGALHDKIEKYEAIIARLEEKNTELKDKNRELKKNLKKLAKGGGIEADAPKLEARAGSAEVDSPSPLLRNRRRRKTGDRHGP